MDMNSILARIKERREAIGLSETALGKEAGLSGDAVRNWRRALSEGKSPGANIKSLNAIATTLGVSYSWLVEGKDTPDEEMGMREDGNVYINIDGKNRRSSAAEALANLDDPKIISDVNTRNEIKIGIKGDLAQIIATVDREGIEKLRKKLDAIEALLD
jgi:transcriptional regulator with XRE-family HTH domain